VRVAIEGGIGSGKTTTAGLVAEQLGWSVIFEQTARHPFLADFYADMERYKLETELAFVLLHYHQLNGVDAATRVVTDFSQGKDLLFARMNLDGDDLHLFNLLYNRLSAKIAPPELTIVLDLPLSVLVKRIEERGRSYELNMPVSYLERLLHFYDVDREALGPNVRFLSVAPTESRETIATRVAALVRESLHL
jgi:deoxyguanosine kinase